MGYATHNIIHTLYMYMYVQVSVASSEYTDASELDYDDDDSDAYDVSDSSFYINMYTCSNF